MTDTEHSRDFHSGRFANWAFDWQGDWVRMSVDLGDLGRKISDELRRAAAGIDFDGLRQEIDRTMRTVAEEMQKATAQWGEAEPQADPLSVHINVQAGARPDARGDAGQAVDKDELMLVLKLVVEGKITPEEGVRLIEALRR